jgi:hypothetical protein
MTRPRELGRGCNFKFGPGCRVLSTLSRHVRAPTGSVLEPEIPGTAPPHLRRAASRRLPRPFGPVSVSIYLRDNLPVGTGPKSPDPRPAPTLRRLARLRPAPSRSKSKSTDPLPAQPPQECTPRCASGLGARRSRSRLHGRILPPPHRRLPPALMSASTATATRACERAKHHRPADQASWAWPKGAAARRRMHARSLACTQSCLQAHTAASGATY